MSNTHSKLGFFLGLGGAAVGLIVGLWAPFVLKLSDKINFIFLSVIFVLVSVLLFSLIGIFIFKMRGFFKSISFLIFFAWLQFAQGMTHFLESFDVYEIVPFIRPYLDFDIFYLMPIFFALGFIPFLYTFFKNQYQNTFVRDLVLDSGISGIAKIINISTSNIRINKRRMYDIELQITIPQFGTYVKKISTSISLLEIDKYQVGKSIKVMVSPTNKNTVFIV